MTAVLDFDHLTKSYDKTAVLKDITASIQCGEVIGLLGLNGAGKTTLLETALGFSLPDSGSCKIFGKDSCLELDAATKFRIGFVPQRDELLEGMKCKQYLDLIAGFYPGWNPAFVARLANEWAVPLDKQIIKMSLGQRQKLSIISALGHEPDLIILDEPVASLDPVARRQFLKELVEIASARTRTIIFSTHIVSDLERVASRVWLIKDGSIAVDEELDSLKEHCARVTLPPGMELPANYASPSLLHQRTEQNSTVLVFTRWNAVEHQRLEELVGQTLMPQWLPLEDIFLELHA